MPAQLVKQVDNVAIYELLGSGDHSRIKAMLELYGLLFPQYEHYIPRMRRRACLENEHRKGHTVHYWLVEVDGKPAGLRTFRYVQTRRCGLAHALAVQPAHRSVTVEGRRLAVYLIYECLEQVIRDARDGNLEPVYGMVNEVEPEHLMEYYVRNGLLQLPLKYVEPIFPPEAEGRDRQQELAGVRFSPMYMGFLPNPQMHIETISYEMLKDFVMAFLVDHYGLPEDHPAVLEVVQSIDLQGA
jgi:hypothetical protein